MHVERWSGDITLAKSLKRSNHCVKINAWHVAALPHRLIDSDISHVTSEVGTLEIL